MMISKLSYQLTSGSDRFFAGEAGFYYSNHLQAVQPKETVGQQEIMFSRKYVQFCFYYYF